MKVEISDIYYIKGFFLRDNLNLSRFRLPLSIDYQESSPGPRTSPLVASPVFNQAQQKDKTSFR